MTSSSPDPRRRPTVPPTAAPKLPRVPTLLPFGPVAIAVMGLVAVVLVGAIFALGRLGGTPAAGPADEGESGPETDVVPRKPQLDVLDEGDLAAILPEETRDELVKEMRTWFQAENRRPIDDRSGADETEWVTYLLSEEIAPRLERLPGNVFGALADPARVLDEPGPHRGALVTVWGRVASVDPVHLPTAPETPAWRVRIDDGTGQPWTVTAVREPPPSVAAGKWARAFGVFTKLYPVDGKRPSFGLFTPQALVLSFPPFEAKAIDPAWAAAVKDDTMEASQGKPGEEDAFWKLCAYARDLGVEGYRAKVASGEIRVADVTNSRTLTALVNAPAPHRFEAIRVRGAPLHSEFGLEGGFDENPGHVRELYRGFVVDDLHRPVWVAAPFPATKFSFAGARLVEVEGFFYKRMATRGRSGNMYWLPVVVATSIRPVAIEEPSRFRWDVVAIWLIAAGTVVLAGLWLRLIVRSRRESAEARRRHLERVSRRKGGGAS